MLPLMNAYNKSTGPTMKIDTPQNASRTMARIKVFLCSHRRHESTPPDEHAALGGPAANREVHRSAAHADPIAASPRVGRVGFRCAGERSYPVASARVGHRVRRRQVSHRDRKS